MDDKLGEALIDLRRELKLTEARLRDNHQVCGISAQGFQKHDLSALKHRHDNRSIFDISYELKSHNILVSLLEV